MSRVALPRRGFCIFVERRQQTVLTEHWRVVFRRHYFTSRAALDRSLQRFM
jgi:hypothetical protein